MTDSVDYAALTAQLGVERRKVDVSTLNFSVRELVRMMVDSELNVSPEYQRKFRWLTTNESTFVESVFLGLPIPPIFVATNDDFQWEVVDGLQRLSTLVHYIADTGTAEPLVHRDQQLVLEGLEKLPDLNGKGYQELPPGLKTYFGRQPLQVVALTDKSDLSVRFDLFERLNGGSISLSPQEVRACVYRGDFNRFIERLADNEDLDKLLKLQKAKQYDGTKTEQVLKFFAYRNNRMNFDGKVTHFLNEYMRSAERGRFDYKREEDLFARACRELLVACGEDAYLRADHPVTPLVQFEGSLVAVADLLDAGEDVLTPSPGWTNDPLLKQASTGGTNSKAALLKRIERSRELLRGGA